jgi:uncharacterized SAM-binding protein YcdF (DUF218 family)
VTPEISMSDPTCSERRTALAEPREPPEPRTPGYPLRPPGASGAQLLLAQLAVAVTLGALLDALRGLTGRGFALCEVLFSAPQGVSSRICCLVVLALSLLAPAFGPRARRWPAIVAAAGLAALAGLSLLDAASFYHLLAASRVSSAWPVPFSLGVALALVLTIALVRAARSARASEAGPAPSLGRRARALAVLGSLALAAAVFHIHAFGLTDYRRPADAILVLGARAYADGRPSEALADRVATGVELFQQGLGAKVLMSGGIGEGGVSEAQVMRRLAREAGVPDEAIEVDDLGVNTEASLRNARAYLAGARRPEGAARSRLLVVSHYHHLPRVKLLSWQQGIECFTVPADEGATRLRKTPYYVLREAAALAFYYLRG